MQECKSRLLFKTHFTIVELLPRIIEMKVNVQALGSLILKIIAYKKLKQRVYLNFIFDLFIAILWTRKSICLLIIILILLLRIPV